MFDNGRLINDTDVPVAEAHRRALHGAAFVQTNKTFAAIEKPIAAQSLRDALESAAREGVDVSAVTDAFTTEQSDSVVDEGGIVEQTVAELKALLDEWDSRHLDKAKALLEGAGSSR